MDPEKELAVVLAKIRRNAELDCAIARSKIWATETRYERERRLKRQQEEAFKAIQVFTESIKKLGIYC